MSPSAVFSQPNCPHAIENTGEMLVDVAPVILANSLLVQTMPICWFVGHCLGVSSIQHYLKTLLSLYILVHTNDEIVSPHTSHWISRGDTPSMGCAPYRVKFRAEYRTIPLSSLFSILASGWVYSPPCESGRVCIHFRQLVSVHSRCIYQFGIRGISSIVKFIHFFPSALLSGVEDGLVIASVSANFTASAPPGRICKLNLLSLTLIKSLRANPSLKKKQWKLVLKMIFMRLSN